MSAAEICRKVHLRTNLHMCEGKLPEAEERTTRKYQTEQFLVPTQGGNIRVYTRRRIKRPYYTLGIGQNFQKHFTLVVELNKFQNKNHSHALHNDISVNDASLIQQWSHKLI